MWRDLVNSQIIANAERPKSGAPGWRRVTEKHTCPVCGRPDNCTVSDDGRRCFCGRVSDGVSRPNAGGQYLHKLDEEPFHSERPSRDGPSPSKSAGFSSPKQFSKTPNSPKEDTPDYDWQVNASEFRSHPLLEDKLVALGSQLGISPAALKSLGCGFDQLASAWTFPEKNGQGKITGILRRFEDGDKRFVKGGERGLYYCRENLQGPGPILIVEGASDTAAGITMGLRTIGRPSNTGGRDQLIELLKPILEDDLGCRVFLVGENDLKDNGHWPGRFGVESISKALARELVRPIEIAMPPQDAKDLLDWRNLCSDELVDWEKKFLSEFSLERVEPSVFIPPIPLDPTVTLDEARKVNLRNMRDNIGKAGVFLNSAATGIGKSTAIQQVIAERKLRSLITVRTHQDARSMESGLQKRGIVARAYPQRITQTPSEAVSDKVEAGVTVNCWNGEATEAVTLGLGVSQCVCPSCPFLERCHDSGYLGQVEQTKNADVVVATHARVARLGLDYWRFVGKNERHFRLHVIEEDAADVLRPCMVISEDELNCADDFLEDALPFNPDIWGSLGVEPDFYESDLEFFFTSFRARAKWLKDLLSDAEECREIIVPMPLAVPDDAQRLLFQLIRQSERKELKRPTMVWSLLFALISGNINLMSAVVTSLQGKPGEPKKLRKEIIAVGRNPPLPRTHHNDS